MSEGIITRRGGASNAFAFIAVNYPSGFLLTASCGSKVLTALNTSGNWIFDIPFSGTWIVTATDGTYIASANVVISSKGQSEIVVLKYKTYLYNRGFENYLLIGGGGLVFTAYSNSPSRDSTQPVKYDTYMNSTSTYVSGRHFAQSGFRSDTSLDLTGFKELHMVYDGTTSQDYSSIDGSGRFGIGAINSGGYATTLSAIGRVESKASEFEVIIDITNINSGYFIFLHGGNSGSINVYEIFLT